MEPCNEKIELDIRGQICPSCLLLTLKEINSHIDRINSRTCNINILTDNRESVATIPDAVRNMGLSTAVKKSKQGYQIRIFKE